MYTKNVGVQISVLVFIGFSYSRLLTHFMLQCLEGMAYFAVCWGTQIRWSFSQW